MLLRVKHFDGHTAIENERGGFVYITDRWPRRLEAEDFLTACCGPAVNGWHVWHEDHRLVSDWFGYVASLDAEMVGIHAMTDAADMMDRLGVEADSKLASGSLAVYLLAGDYDVPERFAAYVVRLNMLAEERVQS